MTNDSLSMLKKLYGTSELPCAVVNGERRVLWRNPQAEKYRGPLSGDVSEIFRNGKPACGTICLPKDKIIHRFNVTEWVCPEDKHTVYIIEHLSSDDLSTLLSSPPVKAYMSYLCGRIRKSMEIIAVYADEADSAAAVFGKGCGEITEQLNAIDKALMMVLREVINPEQLYYVMDPDCCDSTICISDELAAAANDAKHALGRSAKVRCDAGKSVFARMNRGVFEAIVSDVTAECCEGEFYPDELVFSCEKLNSERAAVTVKSLFPSGRKKERTVPEIEKKGGRLYYDYLCDTVCEKYSAAFVRQEIPDGYMCRMEFRTINSGETIILANHKVPFRNSRFSPMALALSELHLEERYKAVDIDAETV